jgi:hypothetical protein
VNVAREEYAVPNVCLYRETHEEEYYDWKPLLLTVHLLDDNDMDIDAEARDKVAIKAYCE